MDYNGGYPDKFLVKIRAISIDYIITEKDAEESGYTVNEIFDALPKAYDLVLNFNHTIADLEQAILDTIAEDAGWPINKLTWSFDGKADQNDSVGIKKKYF